VTRRLIAAAALGAAAGYAIPRALAALRGPRLAVSLREALGGQRAPLSRMSAAIGDVLQPGEAVTYLSASARDRKGRLAVYAVGATDELAHLTWRGDVPDDVKGAEGA
jgi:hypothetical protein